MQPAGFLSLTCLFCRYSLLLHEVGVGCNFPFHQGEGLCLALNNLRFTAPTLPGASPLPSQQTEVHTLHSAQPLPCYLHRSGIEKSTHFAPFWSICPAALSGSKLHPQFFPLAVRAAARGVPVQHASAPLLKSLSGHYYCSIESLSGFPYTPPLQKVGLKQSQLAVASFLQPTQV